jgi:hypothetical protein
LRKPDWLQSVIAFDRKYLPWLIAVLMAGGAAWYWDQKSPTKETDSRLATDLEAADTYIPSGFVLVPIEVANYESLDSILGKFGVVDLYLPANEKVAHATRVASHIKILRAPLNPSHFAVLAREEDSSQLVRFSGPFTVIVQNPKKGGTAIESVASDMNAGASHPRTHHSRVTIEVPSAE